MGLQVVEAHPLFPYFLEKRLAILHLLFSFTSKWCFCYIYMCVHKKIVIERTRDLIYLKFVATDFFSKIISPSTGENSGDLA